MAQAWHDLLFAHWPVPLDQLRRVVPAGLQVDTFDGQAWLGVVAFRLGQIHLRGLPPVPGLAAFPEVNLRTYVRRDGRPGVLFLSLHCPNRLAMALARPWFRLPYHYATTRLCRAADWFDFAAESPRGVAFAARYRPVSAAYAAPAGSLEAWLTERYCYYTAVSTGANRLYRCDIAHARWRLSAADAEVRRNSLAVPFGIDLCGAPALCHVAQRMDARIWPLRRI